MIIVILLLVMQVTTQGGMTDITSSGDGEDLSLINAYASIIDEIEDIQNLSTYDFLSSTVATMIDKTFANTSDEGITSLVTNTDTSVINTNDSDAFFTTHASTTMTTIESTTVTSVPTTTTTTTKESTITTTESAITTVESTITTDESTVKTTESTTKKPSTTVTSTLTKENESKPTPAKIPQAPTIETTDIPDHEGKQCSFVDNSFMCDEEIYCYGEGGIDCSEELDADSAETTSLDKISLSPIFEDYSDYEDAGDGIETFPPDLIGVKPPKKNIPFLFRMGSLGSTTMSSENSQIIQEKQTGTVVATLTTVASLNTVTLPTVDELSNEETSRQEKTTMAVDADITDFMLYKTIKTSSSVEQSDGISTTLATTSSTDSKLKSEEKPVQDPVTTVEYVSSGITKALPVEELSSAVSVMNDTYELPLRRRRKREENIASGSESSSSSMSLSFHMAAVENSKRIRVKACKITGNLVCSPPPTTAMCKGKTACQVLSETAESSEKSRSTKGIETWAIAVIAICAIASALTVSLLVYLVFTSWKKLKVQPQNGVTTLTYVNSNIP